MIFAANFKTNHTRATTKHYIEVLTQKLHAEKSDDRVYIFPPATALDRFEGAFTLGVQNAYPAVNGAYTGEIGLEQLEEFGINTILIGHSERRQILGESQESVAQKFAFFQEKGFEILYCIGEPLEIRERGDEAVMRHLLSQFEGIDVGYEKLIVAYEPIWAIGTGRSATVKEIASTHEALRQTIKKPLLYGGSVNAENIKEISKIAFVDGVLVGSASLDAERFASLVLR
ncbi:MAG TPA: triose-phosphate isomerase [Sulfurovum sp.]|jgi:triosephosphate isomerase|nr:MAG: triose-phosphate isomerase [Sulfurovum sp. 35-42-20]OYZ24812.1 MAG: triose-phosphate isomerase [Sulfurovum sp. 16-42-52]OYZ49313.1 MAG: triose-phosphate isomerase [Sulfurovum sp. 24-42-9]OZA44789.1 MAG: triose-phosphate isomerase [Sulfurovum sp. 17-42-90]OZA59476.1 MAG: triose-phosphate isomerase [Sulfurovum sp. 39-42-12]HQR73929.1 triose-phosphate isomerase [Sulfurovum sp.]